MQDSSSYGTGVRSYGMELDPPDLVIITQWLTVAFIPLIPLRRAKCRYVGRTAPTVHGGGNFQFHVVERMSLSLSAVVATYLCVCLGIILALAPLTVMFCLIMNRAAIKLEVALLLLFTVWPVGFVILLDQWQERLLKSTWGSERLQLLAKAQVYTEQLLKENWSARHVLPEWAFIGALLVGLLPGVAIGVWWGWVNQETLQIAGLISGVCSVVLVAAVDWVLVRRRRRKAAQTEVEAQKEDGEDSSRV